MSTGNGHRVLMVGLPLLASISCSPSGNGGSGTARMVARLDSIAQAVDRNPTQYANDARLALIRDRPVAPDLRTQLLHRAAVAEQLLRSGHHTEAASAFEDVQRAIRQEGSAVPAEFTAAIADNLAIAYHRAAQDIYCLERSGSLPCSFPMPAGPAPPNPAARSAVRAYTALLSEHPDNMEARWLLNTAYMMLGEYPAGVPGEWLLPPAAFAGEPFTPFFDAAPELGLDVPGLAGGSIADDFDGDGFLDIMASSWGLRDQLRFFKNMGDGTFEDRTAGSGLEGIVGGLNTVHADYNNDGFPDVFVLRGAWLREGYPNSLLRSNGDGTFDDVTEEAGLLEAFPTQTAAWSDFDNDGWVDLYIGNESIEPVRNPCRLFRNNGDGTFTDVAERAGVAVIGFVKGVAAADYDNDGRTDLYLSRLREPNLLFHNDGNDADGVPHFSETAAAAGVEEPVFSFPTWFFDYDNDGFEDLFVSGFFATSGDYAAEMMGGAHTGVLAKLYRNNGDGTFADRSAASGAGRTLLTMGSNFGDLDNDGFLDFYAGTGNPDLQAFMPNRMFRNTGTGTFSEVTASGGFGHLQKGHGVSFADFDNDGDQDIHHVVGGAYTGDVARNVLYLNPGHGNHWLTIRLQGRESNRPGIGARIRVTTQTPAGTNREIHLTVTTGGSFGANSLQQEMGLGDAVSIVELRITWPSGQVDRFGDVALDQVVRVVEGAATFTVVPTNPVSLRPRR